MARWRGPEMDTRGAVMDAAWELFQLRGYDLTSVDAIVERAGLSKGTFFHHFPTKAHLLQAVCDRVATGAWGSLGERLQEASGDALRQLDLLIEGMRQWRTEHADAIVDLSRALAKGENALLRLRLLERMDALFHEPMRDVLAAGSRQGVFDVDDADQTARLVGAMINAVGEENLKLFAAQAGKVADTPAEIAAAVATRRQALRVAVERIVGAPAGTLARPSPRSPGRRRRR
jgi:AcrR family transcriptional regulator